MTELKCNQKDPECNAPAAFRFTWPGRDEAGICIVHAVQLRNIAQAMGLYVQLIPLTAEDYLQRASARKEEKNG